MKTFVSMGALAALMTAGSALAVQTQIQEAGGAGNEAGVGAILRKITGGSTIAATYGLANTTIASNNSFNANGIRRVNDLDDRVFYDGNINLNLTALYWGNSADNPSGETHRVQLRDGASPLSYSTTFNGPSAGNTWTVQGSPVGTFQPDRTAFYQHFSAPNVPSTNPLNFRVENPGNNTAISNQNTAVVAGGSFDRLITFDITDYVLANRASGGGLTTIPGFDQTNSTPGQAEGRPEFTNVAGLSIAIDWAAIERGKRVLVLFFETGSDGDYQDLVLVSQGLRVIPLPPAAWAGIGSLGLVAGVSVIRRRRLAAN